MSNWFTRTLRGFSKTAKWQDADEYQKARWAYEGQGAAATKSARYLGIGLIAALVYGGVVIHDRHELATLGDLKFVQMETNRTTGDIVNVSITDGKLMLDETKRRQFIRYWIQQWREVPADLAAYNRAYVGSQAYMSDVVYNRIDGHIQNHPVKDYIERGYGRIVKVKSVTPNGNGIRYRVDWDEAIYRNSVYETTISQTADLDLEQHSPRTDEEAEYNMFGLVVKGFYWSPSVGVD